ncbi:hypothetical protein BH09BAC3_BH09BAC3_07910 [soil metagenome]
MKKIQRLSWFIFFLLATSTISAQNRTIDSLKSVLALSGKPDDFKVLWELAYELFDVDNLAAVDYATRAHETALKMGDSLEIVKSGRIKGQLLRKVDRLEEATSVLAYTLSIAKRHHIENEIPKILGALANVYAFTGEYDHALECRLQTLAIWEKDDNKKQISEALFNLGFIYYKMEDEEVALAYFHKALRIKSEINYPYDLDRLYVNIGLCYCYPRSYNKAIEFFNKALTICSQNCRNDIKMEANFGMGVNAKNARKNYLAKLYFERSLTLSEIENNQRFQLENLVMLSDIAISENDRLRTQEYLDRIGLIPSMNDYVDLAMEYYKLRSKFSELNGDFERANFFKKEYIEFSKTSFNSKLRNNIMKVQSQFTERQNFERIESQTKLLLLQERSIRNQKLLNISFALCFILIIWLVIILIRRVQEKQRLNYLLDQRVRQRTLELEKSRDDLMHAHYQQALILKKASGDLVASLATIKGLAEIPVEELKQGHIFFFKEAQSITERLINYSNADLRSE